MFTVCPKCALTLIVTAADLRVGQGYVRCGRCSNVFNALVGLIGDAESQQSASEPEPPPDSKRDADASGEDGPSDDKDLEFDPASTNVSDIFVESKPEPGFAQAIGTGTFRTLVLRNADLPPSSGEERDPESDEIDRDLRALALRLETAAAAAAPVSKDGTAEEAPGEDRSPDADPPSDERAGAAAQASAAWLDENPVHRTLTSREIAAWSVASVLLIVVLAAQIIHHYRDSLATDPRFGAPLTSLYSALGLRLFPRWDLSAYDVRQLGAIANVSEPGVLTVRASILNKAEHSQPLPLLRVTVQNRYGTAVATRDVPAATYAAGHSAGLMAAGQRIDAQIAFRDPGLEVVGFELDACLPQPDGTPLCSTAEPLR